MACWNTVRMDIAPCPCGSGRDYAACCGALHGGASAVDAEALMRSRYSAYVRGLEAYLLASWHPATRPAGLDMARMSKTKWLRLKVTGRRDIDRDHAEVDFVARFIEGGRHGQMTERSRFVREEGRWYYLDGDVG